MFIHHGAALTLLRLVPQNGPQQRPTRVAPPGAQQGGGPQPRLLLTRGPRRPGGLGAPLGSAALEDRLLGGRRCPCALWGLRLLSRRHGWAGKVLGARPIRRAGSTPNRTSAPRLTTRLV